jgi:hypothetical protein
VKSYSSWVIRPCSLLEVKEILQRNVLPRVSHIPEDSNLHTREDLCAFLGVSRECNSLNSSNYRKEK